MPSLSALVAPEQMTVMIAEYNGVNFLGVCGKLVKIKWGAGGGGAARAKYVWAFSLGF